MKVCTVLIPTFVWVAVTTAATASSPHCSAPIWEGGRLMPTKESCQQRSLKGAWCQKNPSNCATCSGIWCTADDAGDGDDTGTGGRGDNDKTSNDNNHDDGNSDTDHKQSNSNSKGSDTKDPVSNDNSGNDGGDVPEVPAPAVCTGRPELDALLARGNIAKVSQITASGVYTWAGFCRAARMMAEIGLPLNLGAEGSDDALAIGAANIASLLAQTMWESGGEVPFSACDENNYTGKPDAACTQRYDGQRYDSLVSPTSCNVDPHMKMTAETHASWTPGPMQCAPGTITEGCCWWGRGAIQTTGPHNYAQLQRDVVGKLPQFDAVDLCSNPEAICQVDELKWLGAMYYWTSVVQREAHFPCSLAKYVHGGFDLSASRVGGADFASGCGGSVNNGYWAATPHGSAGRLGYFQSLMQAMLDNGLAARAADMEDTVAGACDGGGSSGNHGEASAKEVCGLCSKPDNCYVHGWAVPCMQTTETFCSNTHNAVWCSAADTASEEQDAGQGQSAPGHGHVDADADTDTGHVAANDGKGADVCVSFVPDAKTGHCSTFLAAAAQRLGARVQDIVSFEAATDGAPGCAAGSDDTFVTAAEGGLWGGVQYRVCVGDQPAARRRLRGAGMR